MTNQKKRLSDVTKQNTTDRASRLAGSFLPPAPAPPVAPATVEEPTNPVEPAQAEVVAIATEEPQNPVVSESTHAVEVGGPAAVTKPVTAERTREKTRRSASTVELTDIVGQPTPDGVRCTRMIMLCEEHHDLLRELSFKSKKPMTAILYNLLELANQALQREKKKGE
jgi:hypothetical protein